jgi:hypothetical protein
MSTLLTDVHLLLVRDLDGFVREVEAVSDDEHLWQTVPGITNPVGTLALHVAGNLQHYIGAVLGGTGYVRHREAEFSRRAASRAEVLQELRTARRVVDEVLPRLPPALLSEPYPERQSGLSLPTQRFLLHLCVHLGMHLGQAGYLRRVLAGEARSTGPVPLKDLASH